MAHNLVDSVAAAKAHQQQERERVFRETGIRVTDHGAQLPATIIHCHFGGCRFKSSARTEGRAIRGLSAHVIRVHRQE